LVTIDRAREEDSRGENGCHEGADTLHGLRKV
jgi:hypothetical protein